MPASLYLREGPSLHDGPSPDQPWIGIVHPRQGIHVDRVLLPSVPGARRHSVAAAAVL